MLTEKKSQENFKIFKHSEDKNNSSDFMGASKIMHKGGYSIDIFTRASDWSKTHNLSLYTRYQQQQRWPD